MPIVYQAQDADEFWHDTDAEQLANAELYCVIAGGAVTEDGADLTVDIAETTYRHNGGTIHDEAETNALTLVADGSNERWSYATKDSAGGSVLISGTPAPNGSTEPSKPELGDRTLFKAYKIDAGQTIANDIPIKLDKRIRILPFGANPNNNTVASAATLLLPASGGQVVHVTGSVQIDAIEESFQGDVMVVIFDAAPLLNHNGSSFILMGAVDYTPAANDVSIFECEGGGANWREINRFNPATRGGLTGVLEDFRGDRALLCWTDCTFSYSGTLVNNVAMDYGLAVRLLNNGDVLIASDPTNGAFQLTTSATSGGSSMFVARGAEAAQNPHYATNLRFDNAQAAIAVQAAGFGPSDTLLDCATVGNNKAIFRSITTGVLFAVTSDGVTEETTDLSAFYTLDTDALFEVRTRDGGVTWEFLIDGVVRATHSTNVPATTFGMHPLVGIENNTTTAILINNVDFVYAHQDRG